MDEGGYCGTRMAPTTGCIDSGEDSDIHDEPRLVGHCLRVPDERIEFDVTVEAPVTGGDSEAPA